MIEVIELGKLQPIKNNSVDPSKFTLEKFEYYSIPAYDKGAPDIVYGETIGSSKIGLQLNDVVLSRIVPHIRRAWIIESTTKHRKIGSSEWILFRSNRFYPKYLRYFLLTDEFNRKFMSTIKGVGGSLLRADPKQVSKFNIALPLLEEQKRIAAILDAADLHRQKTKDLLDKYDELSQALFLDMFGDPVANPKGHKFWRLGDVCFVKGGKRLPKGEKFATSKTNHPYIKAGDIKNEIIRNDNLEYITDETHQLIKNYIVNEGDVLITVVGANIGEVGITPKELHKANLTENANKLLVKNPDLLLNRFLFFQLQTMFLKQQISKKIMAVGVPKLAIFRIEELLIFLPSLAEQQIFSHSIELIRSQKSQAEQSLQKAEELFQSLLQKAFKGEL
jgi:type I restriction enzyme S subunit